MAQPMGGVSEPSPTQTEIVQNVIFGSVEKEILNKGKKSQNNNKEKEKRTEGDSGTQEGTGKPEDSPKISSSTCRPVAKERPRIALPGDKIDSRIEFMRDHALIGKFIGYWPTEKALYGWIAAKWKPKGDVTLQLGPKGFFTAIFYCQEDKFRILVEGPYFFNSAGLYLRD